jgi:hypothetical protein
MVRIFLGSVATIVLLCAAALTILMLGFVLTTAIAVPPSFERQVAAQALSASIHRRSQLREMPMVLFFCTVQRAQMTISGRYWRNPFIPAVMRSKARGTPRI